MSDLRKAAQAALEALEYEAIVGGDDAYRAERDAIRAALAQPEQEPDGIGWLKRDSGYFTAPTPRKPLTDEEVRDLWSWSMTAEAERTATTQQHAFARAIERAHGIGEQHGS